MFSTCSQVTDGKRLPYLINNVRVNQTRLPTLRVPENVLYCEWGEPITIWITYANLLELINMDDWHKCLFPVEEGSLL